MSCVDIIGYFFVSWVELIVWIWKEDLRFQKYAVLLILYGLAFVFFSLGSLFRSVILIFFNLEKGRRTRYLF